MGGGGGTLSFFREWRGNSLLGEVALFGVMEFCFCFCFLIRGSGQFSFWTGVLFSLSLSLSLPPSLPLSLSLVRGWGLDDHSEGNENVPVVRRDQGRADELADEVLASVSAPQNHPVC